MIAKYGWKNDQNESNIIQEFKNAVVQKSNLLNCLSQNHLFGPICPTLINIGHDECTLRPSSWRHIIAYTLFSRPQLVHKKLGYTVLMGGQ